MAEGDTWINALLGAVATVVLAFLPLSPMIGGGLAAYLQRGDSGASIRVGALSGAIAAIPMIAVVFLLGGLVAALPFGAALLEGPVGPTGAFSLVALFVLGVVLLFFVAYTVAFSALGGIVGGRLADEGDR